MNTKSLSVSLALYFVGATICLADPQIGTWKLNEAKSKLNPTAVKTNTAVYSIVGDNINVVVEAVDKDGNAIHNVWTGKFDGKAYPVVGDPKQDARSYRIVDANTIEISYMKDGKITGLALLTVSAYGKTRTVTPGGDTQGKAPEWFAVYDKQ
jgi:hypothetical protein